MQDKLTDAERIHHLGLSQPQEIKEGEDMKLTSSNVEATFMDCLFNDGEDTEGYIKVEGMITNVGFHPIRLEGHKQDIIDMLSELPDQFKQSGGGGWSFLNACNDNQGNQWTDLHRTMEQLFLLGLAIDKVVCQMPRELWSVLPGGVPYYMVKT